MLAVVAVDELAVNVATAVQFFWIVNVASFTAGIVGLFFM